MTSMGTYGRQRWTGWQITVAIIAGTVAVGVSPLFFASLFMTVRDLLAPSFGPWPWIVPIATEGSFVVLYLLDILLTLRRKPMGWLRWAPYPFAAGSLTLNVYAGHGHPADAIGHAMVTVAFFLPVLAMEAAIRMLSVSEEDVRMGRALADARQYAVDLCRSLRGPLWRWRVPALLRRQIIAGRFPDEVREEIERCVRLGKSGGWQRMIREWVTGPDALHLATQAQADSQSAAETIARTPLPAPAQDAAGVPSGSHPDAASGRATQRPSEGASEGDSGTAPGSAAKGATRRATKGVSGSAVEECNRIARRHGARKVPEALLIEAVRELFDGGQPVTPYRIAKELPVGETRAKALHETVTAAMDAERRETIRAAAK